MMLQGPEIYAGSLWSADIEPGQRLRWKRRLLEVVPGAMIVRDPADRVIFWNSGAESLFGHPAADVIGRSMQEATGEEPIRYRRAFERLIAEGSWSGEFKREAAGRGRSPVVIGHRWRVSYGDDGTPDAYLAFCSDLTAEKAMEEESLRAKRIESIGALAGGVAHDLNNVLTPIIMAAPMLREDLPVETREMIVATIEDSANRGAEMVRQVLTFARGVEGERVLVQLGHLLKGVVHKMRETVPETLKFTLSVSTRELWPVLGDAAQLSEVLLRLSENAVQAMPEGGRIELTATNVCLDQQDILGQSRPGEYISVCVSDHGKGIPSPLLERIFDPFFTTREQGKGAGLGLSTALGIVRSHGGFIRAESEPDQGSVFTIYLPRAADTGEGMVESAGVVGEDLRPPAGRGELILLVDDEESILRVSAHALEDHGYRVLAAGDGTEALARFAGARGAVKVVITDLKMPLMDGVVLIRALRQMDPVVRVVVSTGREDEAQVASLRALKIDGTLPKPYVIDTLLRVVRQALDVAA